MTVSQNGWGILKSENSKYLHTWIIPAHTGEVRIPLRRGPCGLILAHHCLWFAERIEPVEGKGDDFGWSPPRLIPGSNVYSNHGSGTAEDLNSSIHPQNTHTFSQSLIDEIHLHLAVYEGAIRWGGDYHTSTDEMHWEINQDEPTVRALAQRLILTPRGRRLMKANPDMKKHIV